MQILVRLPLSVPVIRNILKMKTVIAFVLLGLSSTLASPTCSDYSSCVESQRWENQKPYRETAAELNEFCKDILKELDCQLDYIERCPNTLLGAFNKSLKMYRSIYARICKRNDPMRQQYLKKAHCLNQNSKTAEDNCVKTVLEKEYCKRLPAVLKCTEEEINQACGQDGATLVSELFQPKYAQKDVFCKKE